MKRTPLLLLHGALGEQNQFNSLASQLNDWFAIYRLNFEGHGEGNETNRPFRIEYFAENILSYLEEKGIDQIDVFGYSLGGYVALYLAKQHSRKVNRIATLGTILQWDEEKADTETVNLDADKIEEKVPLFGRQLEDRHKGSWKTVVSKTREMMIHLGQNAPILMNDWRELTHRVRLHVGDRDNTAGVETSLKVYSRLDHGELGILPKTSHPLEKVNEKWLITSLVDFFGDEFEDA